MAAATVLFTLIPCAAATAQPRTEEPSGSTYYDWTVRAEGWQQDKATPSDGVTTQQELQQRARSQPKETYTVSAEKLLKQSENYALTQPDPVSVTECREHFDEHPDQVSWYKNRHSMCANSTITIPKRICTSPTACRVVGAQQFRLILLANSSNGVGANGEREIIFQYATDKFASWGDKPPPGPIVTFMVECAETNGPQCLFDSNHIWYWNPTLIELRTKELVSPTYRFIDTSITGIDRDKKNFFAFYPKLRWQLNESISGPEVLTRCDQAPYLQKGGCVFSGARPVLRYSKSNPAWTEFTQHLSDALSGDITDTKPGIVGKEIPGDRDSGKPLTRLYSGYLPDRYNRNNAIAIANCKKYWGKDYATNAGYPRDCDEYPFRSTFEGAAYNEQPQVDSKWSYSSRPIRRTHNRKAGGVLEKFYRVNHIIHGDKYWVGLTP